MAFFFSAQISISSFCGQEMRLPSFIFNWISNINLLSLTGPFMSPSLPSKLFRGGIKGFACPLHYSSSWITHPQPARSNKTGMEILRNIHSPPVLINFLLSEAHFNSFPHFVKKNKKKNIWRWECSDAADCMLNICFNTGTVSCCHFTARLTAAAAGLWLVVWMDVFRPVIWNDKEAAKKRCWHKK